MLRRDMKKEKGRKGRRNGRTREVCWAELGAEQSHQHYFGYGSVQVRFERRMLFISGAISPADDCKECR